MSLGSHLDIDELTLYLLIDKPTIGSVGLKLCTTSCTSSRQEPHMTFITFLILQIDRLKDRASPHSSGPKKPSLSQLESEQK